LVRAVYRKYLEQWKCLCSGDELSSAFDFWRRVWCARNCSRATRPHHNYRRAISLLIETQGFHVADGT
jgi:hypothetical protein